MKINVTSLKAIDSGNLISVKIELSDGENVDSRELLILASQYSDLRIAKGAIDTERFDEIAHASKICSAYRKGLFLLGYGACSQKKLIYKLKMKGFDQESSQKAARMLSEAGYINEDLDAVREIEKCLAKLWGKKRIISHLYSKGFTDEAVSCALRSLENIDFADNCEKLIRRDHKKQFELAKKDKSAYNKLCASLLRMGYSFSEIKEASIRLAAH